MSRRNPDEERFYVPLLALNTARRVHWRPAAIARSLWLIFARGHHGETCNHCGRRYLLWWINDAALFERVTPDNGLCCPRCFDRRAEAIGIDLIWQPQEFRGWHERLDAERERDKVAA